MGPDVELVEHLEAHLWVVRGDVNPIDVPLDHGFDEGELVALAVEDAPAAGEAQFDVVFHDPRWPALDLDDVRHAVLVGLGRALDPEIVRLGQMRIAIDDRNPFRQL